MHTKIRKRNGPTRRTTRDAKRSWRFTTATIGFAMLLVSWGVQADVLFSEDFNAMPEQDITGRCRFEGDSGCGSVPPNFDFVYTSNSNPTNPQCAIRRSAGRGASVGLRVWDESNGSSSQWGSDCQVAKYFNAQYKELWASYYLRFNPNMKWSSGLTKAKIFRMGHYNPKVIDGTAGTSVFNTNKSTSYGPTTAGLLFIDVKQVSHGSHYRLNMSARCAPDYKCGTYNSVWDAEFRDGGGELRDKSWRATLGDGQWHRVEVRMVMNSAPGARDGIVEVFWDGHLVSSRRDIPWRNAGAPSTATGFNMFTVAGNANNVWAGDTNAEQHFYDVDDVMICTKRCNVAETGEPKPPVITDS